MKAVILTAGEGRRLGALTASTPKPLLEAGGRTLLDWIARGVAAVKPQAVALNACEHRALFRAAAERIARAHQLPVSLLEEPSLSGTGGGVARMVDHLAAEHDDVLVHYGDILTDQPLATVLRAHEEKAADVTLLVHRRVGGNSVLTLDDNGRITSFVERPQTPPSGEHWSFSGIAILSPAAHRRLPRDGAPDLVRELLVPLVATGRVVGVPLTGERVAVDSPERYEAARALASRWDEEAC